MWLDPNCEFVQYYIDKHEMVSTHKICNVVYVQTELYKILSQ